MEENMRIRMVSQFAKGHTIQPGHSQHKADNCYALLSPTSLSETLTQYALKNYNSKMHDSFPMHPPPSQPLQ